MKTKGMVGRSLCHFLLLSVGMWLQEPWWPCDNGGRSALALACWSLEAHPGATLCRHCWLGCLLLATENTPVTSPGCWIITISVSIMLVHTQNTKQHLCEQERSLLPSHIQKQLAIWGLGYHSYHKTPGTQFALFAFVSVWLHPHGSCWNTTHHICTPGQWAVGEEETCLYPQGSFGWSDD